MSRLPIKGPVRARRGAYLAVRQGCSLSRGAEEALFEHAQILTEGFVREGKPGERSYFGSTMITFDLQQVARLWRGPLDAPRLAELVAGSVRMRVRASRLACAEVARRVTERPLGTALMETRVELRGDTLLMDIDLEVPIGVPWRLRRATP